MLYTYYEDYYFNSDLGKQIWLAGLPDFDFLHRFKQLYTNILVIILIL